MNLSNILEDIKDAEGVSIGEPKILYIREDEVLRLILKYGYDIEYTDPKVANNLDIVIK